MKLVKKIGYCLIIALYFSCVKTDDFQIPEISVVAVELNSNTTISAIKNIFIQNAKEIYTFGQNDNAIITGYVISSDESGNFYKKLIIQDNYFNPTTGIEIVLDQKAMYTKYNFGRKIFIKMAGLSVTENNGLFKIGYLSKNKIKNIPESLIDKFIIRTNLTEEIIPKMVDINDFSNQLTNVFIKVNGVQFKKDEVGRTLAGDAYDEFNGERVLVQCSNQWTTTLSTSTYSDFISNLIPDGKGEINAILTKDFSAKKFVLVINNPTWINFSKEDRCDPFFLDCEELTNNEKILFYENFDQLKSTKDIEALGWSNVNTNFGNGKFKKRSKNENVYMQISAYNTEENYMEAWLVSPIINLEESENEILTFKTRSTFDNGTILTVWVTNDIEKEIKNANWTQLDAVISKGSKNGDNTQFISSGQIGLSCLTGNIRIGFKYQGSDPSKTTTYDIDHILITGN